MHRRRAEGARLPKSDEGGVIDAMTAQRATRFYAGFGER